MQPDDTIGYWLSYAQRCYVSVLLEVLRRHCIDRGKTYVVTPSQWALMSLLAKCDGQTITTLAQQLSVDAPSITNIVKRLEQSDLVVRVRDQGDQRVVTVSLTTEGQDIICTLNPLVALFNEQVFPTEQRQVLLAQLRQLVASVSEIAPDVGDRLGLLIRRERGTGG
jgi:DNA-binding MarR family transcriptional regulator